MIYDLRLQHRRRSRRRQNSWREKEGTGSSLQACGTTCSIARRVAKVGSAGQHSAHKSMYLSKSNCKEEQPQFERLLDLRGETGYKRQR